MTDYVIKKEDFVSTLVKLIEDPAAAGSLDDAEQYDHFIGDLVQVVADHTGVIMSGGLSRDGDVIINVTEDEHDLFKKTAIGSQDWVIVGHKGADEVIVEVTGTHALAMKVRQAHFQEAHMATIETKSDYLLRKERQASHGATLKPGM